MALRKPLVCPGATGFTIIPPLYLVSAFRSYNNDYYCKAVGTEENGGRFGLHPWKCPFSPSQSSARAIFECLPVASCRDSLRAWSLPFPPPAADACPRPATRAMLPPAPMAAASSHRLRPLDAETTRLKGEMRRRDQARLAAGEVTPEQLQAENSFLPGEVIRASTIHFNLQDTARRCQALLAQMEAEDPAP